MIDLGNGWSIYTDATTSDLMLNGWLVARFQIYLPVPIYVTDAFKDKQQEYAKYFTAFRMHCLKDRLTLS